jgi:hypothetical protein
LGASYAGITHAAFEAVGKSTEELSGSEGITHTGKKMVLLIVAAKVAYIGLLNIS